MDQFAIKYLKKLTDDFYNTVALNFDRTRKYQWAGWKKVTDFFEKEKFIPNSVLDVACGNGRFVETLKNISPDCTYLGVDNNKELLKKANEVYAGKDSKYTNIEFMEFDVYKDWEKLKNKKFDLVVAFGIVHHLVDEDSRNAFFKYLKSKINDNGFIVVSFWDFLTSEKLKKKIVEDLGNGDYVLDWKRGTVSNRFAHFYTEKEINNLFENAGLKVISKFNEDGPDHNSNKYFVLS